LIDFSLSSSLASPPRFIFTSSIAVLQGYPKRGAIPEEPVDAESAVRSGYSESKWVSEKIILLARSNTALRPTIIRVGQVSGGANGCWNPLEWIPSIAQSAALTKCIPSMKQDMSLIPLDIVGTVIVELRGSSAGVLHLAHPKLVSWDFVFGYMAKILGVPLVPYSQWLMKLEASESEQAVKQNSALRLLDYYKSVNTAISTSPKEALLKVLATGVAESESPALRNALAIGEPDIQKWLDYWKTAGVVDF